jgi:hypothetical protein
MDTYANGLRKLADMLDSDYRANVHEVCRQLSQMILSMLGVAV